MTQKLTEQMQDLIVKPYGNLPGVTNPNMKNVILQCIDNTLKLQEDTGTVTTPATATGNMAQYTPVVISLLRRTLPSLVGPEIIGTQAMKVPTGRVFVQRVYGINNTDKENQFKQEVWAYSPAAALADGKTDGQPEGTHWPTGYPTPDPRLSAGNAQALTDNDIMTSMTGDDNWADSYTTENGEKLAYPTQYGSADSAWPEMTFSIDFMDVTCKTRALKGRISTEVLEDLKSVHNIDAESELSNILEAEIVAEIDREIVSRIYYEAELGCTNCSEAGVFDFGTDTSGRWTSEKVVDLMIQIEREATTIAQRTRRGRGNFIITSPELAAMLSMNNLLSQNIGDPKFAPVVNPLGTSFVGTLAGRYKVYVDPYMTSTKDTGDTVVVGYKGTSEADAGLIYCPYVPIQMYSQVGEEDFGKRIGIKSRYGLVSNPWMCQVDQSKSVSNSGRIISTRAIAGTNMYYRKFNVKMNSQTIYTTQSKSVSA